jgi:hypothetical protein
METVILPRDSSLLSAANKLPVEQREQNLGWLVAKFKTCQIKIFRHQPLLAVKERQGASRAVG